MSTGTTVLASAWPGQWGDTSEPPISTPFDADSPSGPAAQTGVAAGTDCGHDHRKVGYAPGIAQMMGDPIRAGETVVLSGHLKTNSTVTLEAARGKHAFRISVDVRRPMNEQVKFSLKTTGKTRLRLISSDKLRTFSSVKIVSLASG